MTRALLFAALACVMAAPASAERSTSLSMSIDKPVRLADRYHMDEADFAIVNENRKVVLLLTDRTVALQLSDRVLKRIDRKRDDLDDRDDHALGKAIKSAVLSGVRSALSQSAECDIRDIETAFYKDGEIVIEARNGKRIFSRSEVDDDDVMRSFSESDARAFVRELRRRLR